MSGYLMVGLVLLVLAAYFIWRVRVCARHRMPWPPEGTWLIYLTFFAVLGPVYVLLPSVPVRVVAVVLFLAGSFSVSYLAVRRYSRWLEEENREEEEPEQ